MKINSTIDEHIEALASRLKPYIATNLSSDLNQSYYGVITENGYADIGYHYCSKGLNHSCSVHRSLIKLVLFQIQHSPKLITNDIRFTFYEWLTNHSPYRNVFVSKDIKTIEKDEYLLLDPNGDDLGLFTGSLIALRSPWENYGGTNIWQHILIWYRLVQKGVDPNLAYMFMYGWKGTDSITARNCLDSHTPFQQYFSSEGSNDNYIHNFVNNKPNLSGLKFKQSGMWSSPGVVWGSPISIEWNSHFTYCREYMKSSMSFTASTKNVFNKKPSNVGFYKFDDSVDCIAEYILKKMGNGK